MQAQKAVQPQWSIFINDSLPILCLFVNKVDFQPIKTMEKNLNHNRLQRKLQILSRHKEVYDLYYVKNLTIQEISSKTGYKNTQIYHILHTFANAHPQKAEEMKDESKTFTQEEFLRLQAELKETKDQLKHQTWETAIYKELVEIGKEVYGIDLKKVGTKR